MKAGFLVRQFDRAVLALVATRRRRRRAAEMQWVREIMPLLGDDDPLGTEDLKTHTMALQDAPLGYEIFQKKQDGAIKCVLKP